MNRLLSRTLAGFLMLSLVCPALLHAVQPSAAEMEDARRWVSAKFEGVQRPAGAMPSIEVVSNHGPVQIDRRGAEPIIIGGKTYRRGLYCHAPSKLNVRLPGPAKSFHAEIGVDARAGGGSIIFIASAGGKELFRSDVMHIDTPAKAIDLDLKGERALTLEITDAGDGISCDQGDWATARVTLEDGSELSISDLPLAGVAEEHLSPAAPFSFIYNGKPSREFLAQWKCERKTTEKVSAREHEIIYTDPASGLKAILLGTEWTDSPTIEWTLHFQNAGNADSPIIESIRAADFSIPVSAEEPCTFHYNFGDDCIPTSYEPHADPMPAGYTRQLKSERGRPTQIGFPYYNIERSGRGAIVVLGWPGQWSADVSRDDANGITFRGGQELTHFRLHPGETVRGPRVIVMPYHGDWLRGQNLWRRWMVRHNMPHDRSRPDGKPLAPEAVLCTGNFYPGLMSDAKQELAFLTQHIDAGVMFDAWWQDAGWYPCDGVTWPKTGTWEVDRKRFPKGLREVSDYVHANGKKSIVWFEPERVAADTWLAENHPEWIHGGKAGGLLKIGEPACRAWLTDKIDKLLTDEAIDIYRQDFNIDPLDAWRAADAKDRQGITEIRHVEGYLAYWDELLRRHPGMWIDSCASGGRRNDIETLRRSVPLLRSDWYHGTDGQQCHTYGLSLWFPYQGTGAIYPRDRYWFLSSMVASLTFGPAAGGVTDEDLKVAREMTELHRKMGDCFLGDFWPLTAYAQSPDVWIAWQYDQRDGETGIVQAFHRSQSAYESARFPLRGLDAKARYAIEDLLTGEKSEATGKTLIEDGLPVTLKTLPSAAVMRYRKL